MDVFVTKIALSETTTKNDIYQLLKNDFESSPNYNILLDYDGNAETYEDEFENVKVSIVSTIINDSSLFGCRFINKEKNSNVWIIDSFYSQNEQETNIFIKLSCNTQFYSKQPKFNKPHIVKNLIKSGYCKQDGLFPISDEPIKLKKNDIDICTKIMQGTVPLDLPIVYISFDMYRDSLYAVDTHQMAKSLSGVAHVLVEPDALFSRKLSVKTKKRNPFGGYIGVYFPNTNYRKIIPTSEENGEIIQGKVLTARTHEVIREAMLTYVETTNWSWEKLQASLARNKITQKTNELDEWMCAIDDEIKSYQDQINKLQIKNSGLEVQIENKDEKITDLNTRISSLDSQLEGLKRKYNSQSTVEFEKSNFNEIYPNEIKDAVLMLLQQIKNKLDKNGRSFNIIEEILQHNDCSGYIDTFLKNIESALKNKSLDGRRAELEKLGFAVDKDSHDKIKLNNNNELMFTLPNSPSDYRTVDNLMADIKKKIDIRVKLN